MERVELLNEDVILFVMNQVAIRPRQDGELVELLCNVMMKRSLEVKVL